MEKWMDLVSIIGFITNIGMKDNTKITLEMDLELTIRANLYSKVAFGREET
jgi:hypothetical protein